MSDLAKDSKKFTILVVDDEDLLREAVSFDFKRKGYNVLTAPCGDDALAILEQSQVDVVISDVRMPNGNGLELLAAIKKKNAFSPVVMFITGFADITLEEAYDLGADAVFPKPFDRKALQEAVERAVQPQEARFNRKAVRVEVNVSGSLKAAGTTSLLSSQILNVGRGGFFASLTENFPETGTEVKFSIDLGDNENTTISGDGIVRWVRQKAEGPKHPAGCGVEFLRLDDDCRKKFLEKINTIKTKAFIPIK